MINNLLNIDISHWTSFLLGAIPALLNIYILFYVSIKFQNNKTSKAFILFVLAQLGWQMADILIRSSSTAETALFWNSLLCISWIFIMPLGIHFCYFLVGKKKIAESLVFQAIIYAPAILLLLLSLINVNDYIYVHDSFWGWAYVPNRTPLLRIMENWISFQGLFMLSILIYYWNKLPKGHSLRKQVMIITIGLSIPVLVGISTEVVIPYFYHSIKLPVASTFMITISIAILFAMKKYKLFNISESLKTRTILKAMTDILIVLTPNRKILFVNDEGQKALGIDNLNLEHIKIDDFLSGENTDPEKFIDELYTPILEGEKIRNFSAQLTLESGKKIPVLISATAYKVGFIEKQVMLLIHDISELVQTQQQLAIRAEELKSKSEELNMFFYRTTHDFKGPVSSISALSNIVKVESDPKLIEECLDKIDVCAKRLNSMILDFVEVMNTKEKKMEISPIDFPEITKNIIKSIEHTIDAGIVDFKVSIQSDIHFYSDQKFLDSIIYNLVSNAVNYRKQNSEEKSFVYLQVSSFEKGVMIKVNDNGIGIQKEIQEKIFFQFFRGSANTNGTGLGLYILKSAVSKLNGNIVVESEFDKGSTFIITLPNLENSIDNSKPLLSLS
ncbi:MAG: ATP-binding protein [Bacteroidetes bacterium]|nr:ATP-binding protein [Bacteroidota bacterium]